MRMEEGEQSLAIYSVVPAQASKSGSKTCTQPLGSEPTVNDFSQELKFIMWTSERLSSNKRRYLEQRAVSPYNQPTEASVAN